MGLPHPSPARYLPSTPGGSAESTLERASKIKLEFLIRFQTEGLGKSRITKFYETQSSFRDGREDTFGVARSLAARGEILMNWFATLPLEHPSSLPSKSADSHLTGFFFYNLTHRLAFYATCTDPREAAQRPFDLEPTNHSANVVYFFFF